MRGIRGRRHWRMSERQRRTTGLWRQRALVPGWGHILGREVCPTTQVRGLHQRASFSSLDQEIDRNSRIRISEENAMVFVASFVLLFLLFLLFFGHLIGSRVRSLHTKRFDDNESTESQPLTNIHFQRCAEISHDNKKTENPSAAAWSPPFPNLVYCAVKLQISTRNDSYIQSIKSPLCHVFYSKTCFMFHANFHTSCWI